ncbi:protein TRM32 [Daucus carota subsp. sativus]|uniref:protein TRM32 n=1 Tax=Daucus carota subsp. sativus TaxID=79200 RepID=UPI0007F040F4|nr:PREDICTED: protein TRM32 [Daucus carota subsp. sativus]
MALGRKSMGRDSRVHLKHETRNCMVSILYAIRAKKKLPRKRLSAGRKQTAEDDEVSADTGEAREHSDTGAEKCLISEKPTELAAGRQDKETKKNLETKSSITSRIKAMIYEERSKKGGSHRRSDSCPSWAQPKGTDFSTHSESTGFNFELDMEDEGKKSAGENHCGSSTSGPHLTDTTDKSANKNKMCELCAAKLSRSVWKQSEANQEVRHSIGSNSFLEDDIIDSEKIGEDASVQDLNELLDSLDVYGPKKEYFLKVLEDPGTPLLQYLHSREAIKSKVVLTKSASFPLPGSVGRRVLESTNNDSKQRSALDANERKKFQVCHSSQCSADAKLAGTMVERKEVGTSEPILGRNRSFNGLPPCTPRGLKIEHENRPVINRFKQLKRKISRVIRESRKEKQQPVMDSVSQIVPYDRTTSKVMQEETDFTRDSGSSSCEVDHSTSFLQKPSDKPRFRRATTFTDSMDRYNRLFECTLKRMARYQLAEKSTLRAENVPTPPGKSSSKMLERLSSLPNLRDHSTLLMDSYPSPEGEPHKNLEDHSGMTETEILDEQKPLDCSVDQESQKQLDTAEERAPVNDLEECSESPAQSENLNADEITSYCQDNLESTSVPPHSEPSPPDVSDTNSEKITASPPQLSMVEDSLASKDKEIIMVDNAVDIPEVESPLKQWCRKLLHVQVDTKHVCEFNYVKDILELSGFTADKFLGTWHSTGQPVDPSVIEKVEGFPLTELDCSEDEVRSCNRLLMFDLINEVLIEIHTRSSSYFPKPLTCRSHISPMPVQYHVLGEVWTNVKWYLSWRPESYRSLDDAVGRDLDRGDGWMNLQFDAECAGLEIEDSLFDDLIDEMLYDDLLED